MKSKLNFDKFTAFAFDFDGTLADTNFTHTKARYEAFELMAQETGDNRYSLIPKSLHEEAHRHGSNVTSIIGWVLCEAGIVSNLEDPRVSRTVELKRSAYLRMCQEGIQEVPGSIEFIHSLLEQRPGMVGITTTASLDEVTPFLVRYKLDFQITSDKIITLEDVGSKFLKPDPKAYKVSLNRFGLTKTPGELLTFEDTPRGLSAARLAGTTTVALCTTHSSKDFNGTDYDYLFESFAQLQDLKREAKNNI